ncbi:hypothetical protein [Burkholderia cenocepacia]|uniref:hypothetical protein n=1 Tax=Burkholderia cenocepacia TaxID=95486 RepID=UPI001882F441|nr:hypothetical protein [Burkholderia cenocepacia]MDN7458579.1 hypothetical protein [Burkholderia cenocepacia]
MTEDEIRQRLDLLDQLVGSMHNQIDAMAAREAAATVAQYPIPYSNPALTGAKNRLIVRSSELIERMQELHKQLVGG